MKTNKFLELIKEEAEKLKAENLTILDVSEFPTVGEYHLIMSATSTAHINALVKTLAKKIKKSRNFHVEGLAAKQWILIDCQDVIIHIFTKEARSFYNIERLWKKEKPWRAKSKNPKKSEGG